MKKYFTAIFNLQRLILLGGVFLALLATANLHAQTTAIKGKVTDSTGQAIPGVSVTVQGASKGDITNISGEYSLAGVADKATLVFTYIGYNTQKVAVNGRSTIDVILQSNATGLNEVVVMGYGTQKKIDLTGSVASMDASKIDQLPTTSLSNSLAGRLSGVYVVQSTGVPGVSSDVRIRGDASWNKTPVLYVIDGVVMDKEDNFERLDPSEIDEITVLKDAASAAIYGSRATGGVILVTTKKGKVGKPVISYYGSYSFDKPTSEMKMMDLVTEGIPWMNRIFPDINDPSYGWAHWTDVAIEAMKARGGWHPLLDDVYRDPNVQRHTLNVSGGSERVKYFIAGSFADQEGFIPKLSFNTFNIRANIQAEISKNLTATLEMSTAYSKKTTFNWKQDNGHDDLPYLYAWLLSAYGNFPAYINGLPVDNGWVGNIEEALKNGYNHTSGRNIDALATLKYDVPFVKGLSFKILFSKNDYFGYNKKYDINHMLYTFEPLPGSNGRAFTDSVIGSHWSTFPGIESLQNYWDRSSSYQFNGQINYNTQINQHNLQVLFVYEQVEQNSNYMSGIRNNFPVVRTDQFWATSPNSTDFDLDGGEDFSSRLSYVGKINYSFANKYLVSASVRDDGSLKFAPERRWGIFPAVSAGWRVSEEPFFKNNIHFIDDLKLRASFGVTGNDNVGGWQWLDQYYIDRTYVIGGQVVNGIKLGKSYNVSNRNLTWEKSKSYNYGIDGRLFERLNFSVDYWTRHTTDILGPRTISYPLESGIIPSDQNYGIVNSSGGEIELGYQGKIGNNFTYNINGNFGYATNKVILADVAQNAQKVDDPNGRTLGYIKGLKSAGLIRTQADLDKIPQGYTINGFPPALGMLNYVDVSGPGGKPDGKIDSYDRVVIANYSEPPYMGGLSFGGNWKGFSLEIFFQGNFGHHKFFDDEVNGRQADPWDLPFKFWLDSWTTDNPNGKYPKQGPQFTAVSKSDMVDSDFWLMNASYVRLKQASLAYSLPANIIRRSGFKSIRLSVNATNLLTWSAMKLYDPELNSYTAYPIMKTFTFGLSFSL